MEANPVREFLMAKGLSSREAEVAELVARGHRTKDIADKLYVTDKTVKFHLTNVYAKMKFTGNKRTALTLLAQSAITYADLRDTIIQQGKALSEERQKNETLRSVLEKDKLPTGR